jgi:hypothetical protein
MFFVSKHICFLGALKRHSESPQYLDRVCVCESTFHGLVKSVVVFEIVPCHLGCHDVTMAERRGFICVCSPCAPGSFDWCLRAHGNNQQMVFCEDCSRDTWLCLSASRFWRYPNWGRCCVVIYFVPTVIKTHGTFQCLRTTSVPVRTSACIWIRNVSLPYLCEFIQNSYCGWNRNLYISHHIYYI